MPEAIGGVPFWLLKATALAAGAAFGSFANVLIHRVPRGENIARPGSRCPRCKEPIRWYDNVPVLSWVVLLGRCRRCKAPISLRYPLVELCAAVLSLACLYLAAAAVPPGVGLAGVGMVWGFSFAFCLLLVVLTFVDLEHWRIPPVIAIPGIVLGLLGAFATGGLGGVPWPESVIGLAAGGIGLAVVVEVYYLATRREGMGYGDVLLLAMIGANLGWKALPFVLLAASVQGLLVTVPLLVAGRRVGAQVPTDMQPPGPSTEGEAATPSTEEGHLGEEGGGSSRRLMKAPIPFGPFLALGAMEWLFFGDLVAGLFVL